MSRFLAPIVYPTVTALPVGIAGMHVMYQGAPWYFDGLTWYRLARPTQTLSGRAQVNVGSTPQPEVSVTVLDANVTDTSLVSAWISAAQPTGKDADEVEMDVIQVWAKPGAGQVTFRLTGQTGYIADNFFIDYTIVKAA